MHAIIRYPEWLNSTYHDPRIMKPIFFAVVGAVFILGLITAPALNITSVLTQQTTASSQSSAGMQQAMQQPIDLSFALPSAFAQVSDAQAQSMVQAGAQIHQITLVAKEEDVTLPQGDVIHAMTFNGTIPAPTLRATQGDVIKITMINDKSNKMIHSIDMHPSIISAVPNYGPVSPGQNKTYTFVATNAGFFKYHCEGNAVIGMDQHVFSGMAGGFIIDPKNGYSGYPDWQMQDNGNNSTSLVRKHISPAAKEVALVFSEWYITKSGDYDQTAMFNHQPTYTTINGIPFGYDPVITKTKGAMPLHFKQGDHVRFFLLNVGDAPVYFHIVGEQLGRITDGQVVNGYGKQTYFIGGSDDAIVDVVFNTPGVFAMVNHDYASLFKGQAGLVVVDGPDGEPGKSLGLTNYDNPSNAIPPPGKNSIPVDTVPYYLGTPLKASLSDVLQGTPSSSNQTSSQPTTSQTTSNSTTSNSTASSSGSTTNVSIVAGAANLADKAFSPDAVTVSVGDTVTWTNNDSQGHTITSGTGPNDPNMGSQFNSSPGYAHIITPGATFSHTFNATGTFQYFCELHPTMVGSVTVK